MVDFFRGIPKKKRVRGRRALERCLHAKLNLSGGVGFAVRYKGGLFRDLVPGLLGHASNNSLVEKT